jgi:hypothetical protein
MMRGTVSFEIAQLLRYWSKTLSVGLQDHMIREKIAYGPHPKQYMMLYSPKKLDKTKPLLIYYHGGGWIFGKPELFAKKASLFTKLGYQVVMPSYRKLPKYTADEIIDDVVTSTKSLQKLSDSGKINNLGEIILGGVSAGANLVALLYFNKTMYQNAGLDQSKIKGMFLFAPPLDLDKMKKTFVLSRYAGKPNSHRYRSANPIDYIEDGTPISIFCAHGDKDAFVKLAASESFRSKYDALFPGQLQFSLIENGCHLDAASWAHSNNELRRQLVAWLKEKG